MGPLIAILKRVRRRLLLVRAVEAGLAGAIAAGGAGLALTLARIFVAGLLPAALAGPAAPLVLLPAGFLAALAVRLAAGVSLRSAARAADRAAGLKERLATALEVIEGDARREGVLDARLVEQAREAAAGLDGGAHRFWRSGGRRGRAVLGVLLVLLVGAFIPSRGGPLVAPGRAERAAEELQNAARGMAIAPDLRERIERTIARLRAGAAREGEVNRASADLYRAATEADRRRMAAEKVLAAPANQEFQSVVRAAGRGDRAGAAAGASALASNLKTPPGEGGMSPAARDRLASDLDGAAGRAQKAGLADLAADLDAAARATRQPGPGTDQALRDLAEGMTAVLAPEAPGGSVAAVIAGVRRARAEAGLPAEPAAAVAAAGAEGPASPGAETSGGPEPLVEGPAAEGSGARAAGPEVRPEDRPAVRRYFGGPGG